MLTVIGGDIHIPEFDEGAVKEFLKFIAVNDVDNVIINGDLLDMWEISNFDKVPRLGETFQKEIDLGKKFFETLRKYHSGRIIYIEGNHEFRFKSYIYKMAPALKDTEGESLEERLDLEGFGVEYVQCDPRCAKWTDVFVEIENILIGHFNFVSKGAGNTVRKIIAKYSKSVIQNHVHRGAEIFQRSYPDKQLIGVENFCLCDLNPSYIKFPDWTLGFTSIENGNIQLHPITSQQSI